MKADHKKSPNTTAHEFTPKPLSVEQRSAIDLLCTGATDADVGQMVGVARETVWSWRNEVPAFMAELEKARQQFISGAVDQLRSALPKAVANVVNAVEGGNLKASLELLRGVGLSGNAEAFTPGETDPSAIALTLCLQRLAQEASPPRDDLLIDPFKNPRYEQRKAEILAELGGRRTIAFDNLMSGERPHERCITPCMRDHPMHGSWLPVRRSLARVHAPW